MLVADGQGARGQGGQGAQGVQGVQGAQGVQSKTFAREVTLLSIVSPEMR